MIHAQNAQYKVLWAAGQTVATNNTSVNFCDTQPTTGAQPNYCTIVVVGQAYDETNTTVFTSLKPVESDTTDATAFSTFAGYVSGTDFTVAGQIVSTGSTNAKLNVIGFPLAGRKRYIGLVPVSADTDAKDVAAVAILSRQGETPSTIADMAFFG